MRSIMRTGIYATRLLVVMTQVARSRFCRVPAIMRPGCCGSSSSTGKGCRLMFPYGQLFAHSPQPMHQSSIITSSVFRRRIDPTGQPTIHRGSRHCRQDVATRYYRTVVLRAPVGLHPDAHPHTHARTDRSGCTSQIQNQQALRFHQALREKGIDGHFADFLNMFPVFFHSSAGHALKARPNFRKPIQHGLKVFAGDADHFHVIQRRARRGARSAAQQSDFPKNPPRPRYARIISPPGRCSEIFTKPIRIR